MKILVVDDEKHIVRLLQANLERRGYEVIVAYDGKMGLKKAEQEKPDAVILDVMMPYMDGLEVLRRIRANPEGENLRIMMLTARNKDRDVFEGYHYGADMYYTKPFNPMEIMLAVRRLVGEGVAQV